MATRAAEREEEKKYPGVSFFFLNCEEREGKRKLGALPSLRGKRGRPMRLSGAPGRAGSAF